MSAYRFDCGCTFDVVNDDQPTTEGLPRLRLDIDNIPFDCPKVWDMLGKGFTKGVFQLESRLGKDWSRKLKPTSLEHLSALSTILRPGSLQSIDQQTGLSTTELYCKRKNNELSVEYIHPALELITKSTYGLNIYQEQSLLIAKEIAGFNLQDAESLRKAIGHKLPEEMKRAEYKFLEGCKQTEIVNEDQANEIWNQIKASQRYSFNKCFCKDTIIKRLFKGKYPNCILTIEEMYKIRNNINYAKQSGHLSLYKKWKLIDNYGVGLSLCNDNRVRPNIILDIQPASKQLVYKITTTSNAYIEVTKNHKFPTSNGIKTTNELTINDTLFICGKYDKYFNRIGRVKGYPTNLEQIISIECMGEKETYDITMAGPNHNLVVNTNIITCNSHATCYAINGYYTAYCKAHFPLQFLTAALRCAKYKMHPRDEIRELVNEAKLMGISVLTPSILQREPNFSTDGKTIAFGLTNIKHIGPKVYEKIKTSISLVEAELKKSFKDLSWIEILFHLTDKIGVAAMEKLISANAFSHLGIPRTKLLAQLSGMYDNLSKGEKAFIVQGGYAELGTALQECLERTARGKRRQAIVKGLINLLEHPTTSQMDSVTWIATTEDMLLGIPITCSPTDACDISSVNCSCRDFIQGVRVLNLITLGVEIKSVLAWKVKTGKTAGRRMARLTIDDGTYSLDNVVCFADQFDKYGYLLTEGNTVILQGERDKKNKNNFIIRSAFQAAALDSETE